MECKNCKTEIPEDSRFCPKCGVKLTYNGSSLGDLNTNGSERSSAEETQGSIGSSETLPGEKDKTQDLILSDSDRYEVLEVIGEGGMGKVYKARDKKLNRIVALKRLLKDSKAREKGLARFLKEAQAIAGLNHFNIVGIYDIGKDNIGHFIAMEYVEGETLAARITREGKLKVEDAIPLAKQIAQALLHGHRKGVIHRDIKPANILLTKEGIPKVADFGLAQIDRESNLSRTGYGMGTIDYMPPEQRRDAKNIDHRADIYAFGATFYQMVTGEVPKVIRESKIPELLREIILKAMEERPEDRYFSIDDLTKDLENAEKGKKKQVGVTVEEGACSNCGAVNPKEIRFCKECGTGLFRKCPKCEHEDRIGVKFCGSCGLNFQQYEEIQKHLQIGKEHFATYNYSRALKEFKAILGLDQNHQEASHLATESQKKQESLTIHKTNLDTLLESEDFEAVEKKIKAILEISPNDERVVTLLNELPHRIRRRDSMKETQMAQEALKRYEFEESARHSRNALAIDESNEEAKGILKESEEKTAKITFLLKEGKTLAETHRYHEAIATWQKVFEIYPEQPEIKRFIEEAQERIEKVKEHINRGKKFYAEFLFEQAIEELSKVESLDPTDVESRSLINEIQGKLSEITRLLNTGKELFGLFKFEEAIAEWQKILDIHPDNEEAQFHIADAQDKIQKRAGFKASAELEMVKENYHQVVSDCQSALGLNPTDEECKQLLATAQQRIAEIKSRKLRKGITIAATVTCCAIIVWGTTIAVINHYHLRTGKRFFDSKQYDKALMEFAKVGRFTVNQASLLVAIGNTHKEAKHWDESLKAYEGAKKLTGNKSYIDELISATGYARWVTDGEMLLKKGDQKSRLEAIKAFGGALLYKPQDAAIKGKVSEIKQLAMKNAKALTDKQEWDSALEVYSALAAVFPDDPELRESLRVTNFQKYIWQASEAKKEGQWNRAFDRLRTSRQYTDDSKKVEGLIILLRDDMYKQTQNIANEAKFDEAFSLLSEAEKLFQEDKTHITELRGDLQIQKKIYEIVSVGDEFAKQKEWELAIAKYLEVFKIKPNDETTMAKINICQNSLKTLKEALAGANEAEKSSNWTDAVKFCKVAIEKAPTKNKKEIQERLTFYKQKQKQEFQKYIDMAEKSFDEGDPDLAVNNYRKSAEFAPDSFSLENEIAKVRAAVGDLKIDLSCLERYSNVTYFVYVNSNEVARFGPRDTGPLKKVVQLPLGKYKVKVVRLTESTSFLGSLVGFHEFQHLEPFSITIQPNKCVYVNALERTTWYPGGY